MGLTLEKRTRSTCVTLVDSGQKELEVCVRPDKRVSDTGMLALGLELFLYILTKVRARHTEQEIKCRAPLVQVTRRTLSLIHI